MHEAEAVCLIKPVLDFFINKEKFEEMPTEDEFALSIGCFHDFVKDKEPYWVMIKAQWIIVDLLDFKNKIGDCPATLKEAVLAIVKGIRAELGKLVEEEINASKSFTLSRNMPFPEFMNLQSWGRRDWTRIRKPPI
ncbi:MAG: hypothetical protein LBG57_02405 [Treponema sp.]|nr:hypothetical protein [Treponema sp.]